MAVIGGLLYIALRSAFPATPLSRPSATLRLITRTASVTPSATITASITSSPAPTRRPTWTLQATSTSTASATPTNTATTTTTPVVYPALPTLATPYRYNDLYVFKEWTPDLADQAIWMLQGYPNAFFPTALSRLDPAYDTAFAPAAYAQQEALLRFPDTPYAESWRWGLAYNYTRLNDPRAGRLYADLLETAPDILTFFNAHENRAILAVLAEVVVEIRTQGGAIYLWRNADQLILLSGRFDYSGQLQAHAATGDLTGDGTPELVVWYDSASATAIKEIEVFDLSNGMTIPILFNPSEYATPVQVEWSVLDGTLTMIASVFPACPVTIARQYTWDGMHLSGAGGAKDYLVAPNPEALAECQAVLEHAEREWGPPAALAVVDALLPKWPPAINLKGVPYPADASDELRFRQGMLLALNGQIEAARAVLYEIIQAPADPQSSWIEPARLLLEIYQQPADIFRACQAISTCPLQWALIGLAARSEMEDPSAVLNYLQEHGVVTRSAGYFDFDGDGLRDRWFILRPRDNQRLEFWILRGHQATFIQQIDDGSPRPYYYEPVNNPPVVQLEMGQGFILRGNVVEYVDLEFIPNTFTLEALNAAQEVLLAGVDPQRVARQLEETRTDPRFNCINYRICDRFYYTLGLAYELAGQGRAAVDVYLTLWWENLRSPYTSLARLKMIQFRPARTDTPTPSVTPTITNTPTITPTPTIPNTPDPNATDTEPPTPTPTETPSPTP